VYVGWASGCTDLRPSPTAGATIYLYAQDYPLESLERPVPATQLISEWSIVVVGITKMVKRVGFVKEEVTAP
jgi:hypothetical protein